MKKAILSAIVVIAFGGYYFFKKISAQDVPLTPISETPTPTSIEPNPTQLPIPVPTPTPEPTGQYKNGSYTGNSINFFYGTMQVRAIISGGKLTDVKFLKYPNDRPTSVEINTQAMPILKSEAIKSQTANVDIVSGATDSTIAFNESLGSALQIAKN